jgi:hypothetical protein
VINKIIKMKEESFTQRESPRHNPITPAVNAGNFSPD